jgi:hypothetical protein
MTEGFDRDELRRLVRELLRQTLQERERYTAGDPEAPSNMIERMRHAALPGGNGRVEVDGDWNQFARDCIQAAAHEDLKAAIMTGRLTFEAAHDRIGAAPPSKHNAPLAGASFNLNAGILNEVKIEEIGRQWGRILLGPDVVVTPLARDRARELKLELVRTKS